MYNHDCSHLDRYHFYQLMFSTINNFNYMEMEAATNNGIMGWLMKIAIMDFRLWN